MTHNLTEADFTKFEHSAIPRDLAIRAGLHRVDTVDGADVVGRKPKAGIDYSGIVFPYYWPGESMLIARRLRRDTPDFEQRSDGSTREKAKYLAAPGAANRLYFAPSVLPESLADSSILIAITEGEKKTLALQNYFDARGEKAVAIGLSGVWNWRGNVGKMMAGNGKSATVTGAISDLARIEWKGRKTEIIFDANATTDKNVTAARRKLMIELRERGAVVMALDLPRIENVNGIDDLLGLKGAEFVAQWIERARASASPDNFDLRRSAAERLIEIAGSADLFFCVDDDAGYASVAVNMHQETYRISSKPFRQWLSSEFYRTERKVPNTEAVQNAIQHLEGVARFEGEHRPVFLRLASHEGRIYWDTCNREWQVIEISDTGYHVIESNVAPVRFRRTKGMLALPLPERGGDLKALKRFINFPDDFAWVLHAAWLVAALRANARGFPILILNGEQGSAKSSASKITRRLIDPNVADLRPKPREEGDLYIAARNGWVCGFDNLSGLSREFSDGLCRLATGAGFGKRELFTDEDETLFQVARPVVLNGIDDLADKADLVDRSIFIELPPIPDDGRKEDETLWAEFDREQPRLIGALAEAVSRALRELPNVKLERLPRMADFTKWGVASGVGGNDSDGKSAFLLAYTGNREQANKLALRANNIAECLIEWYGETEPVTINLTDLLAQLTTLCRDSQAKLQNCDTKKAKLPDGWPTTEKKLGNELRRCAPNLRRGGIEILDAGADSRTRKALRTFQRVKGEGDQNKAGLEASQASQASEPSQTPENTAKSNAKVLRSFDETLETKASHSSDVRSFENGSFAEASQNLRTLNPSGNNDLTGTAKDAKDAKLANPPCSGDTSKRVRVSL